MTNQENCQVQITPETLLSFSEWKRNKNFLNILSPRYSPEIHVYTPNYFVHHDRSLGPEFGLIPQNRTRHIIRPISRVSRDFNSCESKKIGRLSRDIAGTYLGASMYVHLVS